VGTLIEIFNWARENGVPFLFPLALLVFRLPNLISEVLIHIRVTKKMRNDYDVEIRKIRSSERIEKFKAKDGAK